MQLFNVPAGKRVRVTSKFIRWVERGRDELIGEHITWEGITTDRYFVYKGLLRRLVVDHTIPCSEYGTWQINTECEILN